MTKKNSSSVHSAGRHSHTCPCRMHPAASCRHRVPLAAHTAIPRARTHPVPHSTAPRPLCLRMAITPSPADHPHGLYAPHSASAWPSTPSPAGPPLSLRVPYSASARPSVAAIHCHAPNPRSTVAATSCSQHHYSAIGRRSSPAGTSSPASVEDTTIGGHVCCKCMFQVF
jgi:hypothetical protein